MTDRPDNDTIARMFQNMDSNTRRMFGARFQKIDSTAGTITMTFEAKAEFCNSLGVVQGGLLSAMLDEVMASAALAHSGMTQVAPTLEMKTSYLSGARQGTLTGEGRVLRMGRSVAFLEGNLRDAAGNLVVTATATCALRPFPEELRKKAMGG